MNTLAERLEAARKAAGVTKTDLYKYCKVSSGAVTQWFDGTTKELKGENLLNAAALLKVNPEWLSTGRGEMLPKNGSKPLIDLDNNPDYPSIRRVTLKLSAGISGYAIDYEVEDREPISFSKSWFDSRGYYPEKLVAIKVKGESMETGLYDGDTVVINMADIIPKDGEVFAVNYEGELVVKRLERNAGTWWLVSDNPNQIKYAKKECTSDICFILGRVVHKQSERI